MGALQLAVGLPSIACAVEEPNNPIYSREDDGDLRAAEAEARRTLPIFWKKFREQSSPYYALDVAFALPAGVENLWVRPLRLENGKVLVRLVSEPAQVQLKYGAEVWIEPGRIVDWQYAQGGKLYGAFTTRALMTRVSPDQRDAAARILAPTPLEPGDR